MLTMVYSSKFTLSVRLLDNLIMVWPFLSRFSCLAKSCSLARLCSLKSTWIQGCISAGLTALSGWRSLLPIAGFSPPIPSFFPSSAQVVPLHFSSSLGTTWRFHDFFSHIDTSCSRTSCHRCKDTSSGSFAFQKHKMMFTQFAPFFLILWKFMKFGVRLSANSSKRTKTTWSSLLQEC